MSKDKKFFDRIPADEIKEIRQWYPPDWANEPDSLHSATELNEEELEEKKLHEEVAKPFTADQLESIHQEAYNEGYEEGFEKGRKEGTQKGLTLGQAEGQKQGFDKGFKEGTEAGLKKAWEEEKNKIQEQVEQFKTLLRAFENPIENQREDIETGILQLVLKISQTVIMKEISQTPDYLQDIIQQLIIQLPMTEKDSAQLYVSREDEKIISNYVNSLEESWQLQIDEALKPGDIQIKTKNSFIDFCLEERFQETVQQIIAQNEKINPIALREATQPNQFDHGGIENEVINEVSDSNGIEKKHSQISNEGKKES